MAADVLGQYEVLNSDKAGSKIWAFFSAGRAQTLSVLKYEDRSTAPS